MAENGTGSGTKARGAGIMSMSRWIRETYGEELYRKLLRSLSPEAAEAFGSPLATEWYPVRYVDEVWRGLRREAHADDPKGYEERLREMGRFIAQDNLSTVFRVILAIVGSPEQMVRSLPRLWGQYFEGVEVELDDSGLAEKRGNTTVRNLGDLHHVSPVACGWIDYGLTKVGAKKVEVWEERYREGATAADPLEFRLSWE